MWKGWGRRLMITVVSEVRAPAGTSNFKGPHRMTSPAGVTVSRATSSVGTSITVGLATTHSREVGSVLVLERTAPAELAVVSGGPVPAEALEVVVPPLHPAASRLASISIERRRTKDRKPRMAALQDRAAGIQSVRVYSAALRGATRPRAGATAAGPGSRGTAAQPRVGF